VSHPQGYLLLKKSKTISGRSASSV